MALQAQLSAVLTTGPGSSSDNPFPSGVTSISFGLQPAAKGYSVATGAVVGMTNTSGFAAIDAIGAGGQVTQALTLLLRSPTTQVKVQMTCLDPEGGADIVSTVPLFGTLLFEFPQNGYLKALAIKGAAQIEYWAAGNQ
jgi:hypothetical protein